MPSRREVCEIALICQKFGVLLIIDRVGELVNDSPITHALARADVLDDGGLNCVIINSLSKSEGLLGYRVGYILGPAALIDYVAARQLFETMNPPTVPAIPIFLALALRCTSYSGDLRDWENVADFSRRMFRATTAIAPREIINNMETLFDNEFRNLRKSYFDHHAELGDIIRNNHSTLLECLEHHVAAHTKRAAGVNEAVVFADSIGRQEDDYCEEVLADHGVAILTESCFRSSSPRRPWYWTRVSLAAPTNDFQDACQRLGRNRTP